MTPLGDLNNRKSSVNGQLHYLMQLASLLNEHWGLTGVRISLLTIPNSAVCLFFHESIITSCKANMSYGKLSRVWWKGDVVYMFQLVALLHLRMLSNEWQNHTIMNEGLWNRCAMHPFTFCNGCHIINHHFRGTCEGTCLRKGKEKLWHGCGERERNGGYHRCE